MSDHHMSPINSTQKSSHTTPDPGLQKKLFGSGSVLAIEATGLVKVFGRTRAVDGVDLSVPKGMVYGFLGPNGAGKTTTIRILATLLQPDEGRAKIFGHDLYKEADIVRNRISLTGQFASVDDDLTGMENLIRIVRLSAVIAEFTFSLLLTLSINKRGWICGKKLLQPIAETLLF